MNPLWIALMSGLIVLAAELLHVRRISRASNLIFGGFGNQFRLLALLGTAALRAAAVSGFIWGAVVLWTIPPRATAASDLPDSSVDPSTLRHLLILLDVSPSMSIRDVADGSKSRAWRASEVIVDALSQIDLRRVRCSVVAFYTDARPVVIDTVDPNVVRNVAKGLPLTGAFEPGKTDIIRGMTRAFDLASSWQANSTSILVISDGDTTSLQGMPKPPASVDRILIAGVGDQTRGAFIDYHVSRQDANTLRQVATRLGGQYFNITAASLPPDTFENWTDSLSTKDQSPASLREWALLAVSISAVMLIMQSLMLEGIDRLFSSPVARGVRKEWQCVEA